MKKLVNSPLTNKIYYATVNEKNHTMSNDKKDVTDNAIMCVFQWFMTEFENSKSGSIAYEITYEDSNYVLSMARKN